MRAKQRLPPAVLLIPMMLRLSAGALCFLGALWCQVTLDARDDRLARRVQELALLPRGDILKPAVLGYRHVVADLLWLRMVQVLGERTATARAYEWIYHALDVVTTLDPHYAYAYQVGGIVLTELARRPELSTKLLQKGVANNPTVWQLPFYLGYNYYFLLDEPRLAAEAMAQAARLPGHPSFVPYLATRMYAEAGDPSVGLEFLAALWRQTEDPQVKESLETRMKLLTIERDLGLLEQALERYRRRKGRVPAALGELVTSGLLPALPQEPFGGIYQFDARTGTMRSSTHPERLRVHAVSKAAVGRR